MTMRVLAVPLLLALAACTGTNELGSLATSVPATPSTPAPSAAGGSASASASPLPGVLVEKTCGGGSGGGCNAGFALDGKGYFLGCEPVSPGSVAQEVMGRGVLYGRTVTVRRITVGTNAGQVAVGPMDDYCGPGQPSPGYFLVAPPGVL